jgi:hypothetical protein
VDSYDKSAYGLVPEYNEMNNVWPVLSNDIYLPLIIR